MKKLLSVILAAVMIFALCVPAFADDSVNYLSYENYMCVGDSIASGCSLCKDNCSETYFDNDTDDYTTVYNSDYIYYGYDYTAIPTAYHSIVADALGANLLQCARSGMRVVEFRYMLDGTYNDYDTTYMWGNTFYDQDGSGEFTMDDLELINSQVNYPEKIKQADILSINLGSNDVFSFALNVVLKELNSDSSDPTLNALREELESSGNIGAFFGSVIETYQTAGKLADLLSVMAETFSKSLAQYEENYTAVLDEIYELNPDITIVLVGVFNPFKDFRLSSENDVDISAIATPIVNSINNFLEDCTDEYDNCYYADVVGTETYRQNYDDQYFWQYFALKVHPTLAGHKYMAEQILSVIPQFPFTDVAKDAWYYDEVEYVYRNGLMLGTDDTIFSPNAVTNRGQFVTVLYRMQGSPSVFGKTEPFKDVKMTDYCYKAVVWAYNNNVTKGVTATSFNPSGELTRAQLVTMLYRLNGSEPVSGSLADFKDAASVPAFAHDAMIWAVDNGIIQGSNGYLMPNNTATRAQLAAIIARYDMNLNA